MSDNLKDVIEVAFIVVGLGLYYGWKRWLEFKQGREFKD